MRSATAASTLTSCASASPTISNSRSTAARTMGRPWYSSKDSPDVNSAINATARWMAKTYFFASSRIEERLGKPHRFEEVGIPDGRLHHEVDRSLEQVLERLAEAEISVSVSRRRSAPEVHQEIQVAVRRLATLSGSRSKELQTLHAIAAADVHDLGLVFRNTHLHGGTASSRHDNLESRPGTLVKADSRSPSSGSPRI